MKKILIINGHPNPESFNAALVAAYEHAMLNQHVEVKVLNIHELNFEPSLKYGYAKRMEVEADIVKSQELISWADHMVWFHPVWWGGLPALTKGFIDRVFTPGFAFKYRENSVWWDKLLSGKTARIITTLDQPAFFYRMMFGRPSVNQLKKSTLQFCGVKPVKVSYFGPIRNSSLEQRAKMLLEVGKLAQKDAL
jgi:putative NADPH-quinone reductase